MAKPGLKALLKNKKVEEQESRQQKKKQPVAKAPESESEEEVSDFDEEAPELVEVLRDADESSEDEEAESDAEVEDVEEIDGDEDEEEAEEDEEDEEDVALSDIESIADEDADFVPYQRLTIDNHAALNAATARITQAIDSLPFAEHQQITTAEPVTIEDVNDDLNRELAFYKQALDAAKEGRTKILAEGAPFSRPDDYFAEMMKTDEHMEKVKEKLIAEATAKKASAEAKRQRDLKKFGKQVQVAKLQERQKEKKDTLEKIKSLKRKRADGEDLTTNDDFEVALEKAEKKGSIAKAGEKRQRTSTPASRGKRTSKNEKFGHGGKKRHAKSNTSDSTNDFGDRFGGGGRGRGGRGGARGGRGGARGGSRGSSSRPGKSKRMANRG
ncbi:rRNA-processing protein EBP2 [Saitoella coloradoensis]